MMNNMFLILPEGELPQQLVAGAISASTQTNAWVKLVLFIVFCLPSFFIYVSVLLPRWIRIWLFSDRFDILRPREQHRQTLPSP